MTTVIRLPLGDVTRIVSPDMFADLGAVAVFTVEADELVATLDATLDGPSLSTARLRLTTRDDAEAAARTLLATAVQDAAAYTPPTLPPGATAEESAAVIADLTVQLAAVTSTLASAVDYLLGTNNNP